MPGEGNLNRTYTYKRVDCEVAGSARRELQVGSPVAGESQHRRLIASSVPMFRSEPGRARAAAERKRAAVEGGGGKEEIGSLAESVPPEVHPRIVSWPAAFAFPRTLPGISVWFLLSKPEVEGTIVM